MYKQLVYYKNVAYTNGASEVSSPLAFAYLPVFTSLTPMPAIPFTIKSSIV